MRIILFTGKGGVGKTSVAAATALSAAAKGMKTLVMSTDPAHSLADSFDLPLGPTPTKIDDRLWGMQVDAQQRLEENWREIQQYALEVLAWTGMSGIEAEELSVVPGLDELFSLADVKRFYDSSEYDLLIVDCAPTAETLRLLSLPEIMSWYIERIFPVERKIVKTVRPVLSRIKNLPPIASDGVFAAVERFYHRIDGVRDVLIDPEVTSIRLVVNAEKMVIAEAQRTFTYLCLFGYRVDSIIVNRIIPPSVMDSYFERWKEVQAEHLETIEASFAPVPILKARLFESEVVGIAALRQMAAELYEDMDPSSILFKDDLMRVSEEESGHALWIRLPFAERSNIDLSRTGDELFVKVENFKRNIVLPQVLKNQRVSGAHFEESWLRVAFEPAVSSTPAGLPEQSLRNANGR